MKTVALLLVAAAVGALAHGTAPTVHKVKPLDSPYFLY